MFLGMLLRWRMTDQRQTHMQAMPAATKRAHHELEGTIALMAKQMTTAAIDRKTMPRMSRW